MCSNPARRTPLSSPLNVVQIEANRRNAQQSTGPRTEIGKKTSSLNALRHGLTSRIVVLPTEDLAAYKTFSAEFLTDLAPVTFAERQFAQTIIDTQWRLNRVRTLEDGATSARKARSTQVILKSTPPSPPPPSFASIPNPS